MRLTFVPLFLLCLVLLGFDMEVVHGQSMPWHPMPEGRLTIFERGNSPSYRNYQALRVDSARLEGTDSAYYFFRCFRFVTPVDTVFDCQGFALNQLFVNAILVDIDHSMGKKMLLRSDSVCAFVFGSGDTFLLKTQARIGDSWPWGNSATAVVDTIVPQTVLGQVDSVKFIRISNGGKIILSKRFGLVQCNPILPFPDNFGLPDTISWNLWGIPSLALGGHFPTFEERYLHQVGDKWVHKFTEGNLGATSYNSGYYFQQKIVGVLQGATYSYQVEYQHLDYYPFGQVGTIIGPNIDTVAFDSAGYDAYDRLPGEWSLGANRINGMGFNSSVYNGKSIEDIVLGGDYDSCANAMVHVDGVSTVIGIMGGIYTHHWDGGDFNSMELSCFALSSGTWGTCPDLHALGTMDQIDDMECNVFPVPASFAMQAELPIGAVMASAVLMNASGRVVAVGLAEANAASIDVSQLPSGLYLLYVSDSDGHTTHRRVAVAR
jgi:hypothetical protein